MKTHDTVGKLERPDGTEALTPEEKVAELNAFFSSVFIKEDMQHLPTPAQVNKVSLETVDITQEKVKRKLVQLKDSKTPGPDLIHPRILSETADVICYPLTLLFRKSQHRSSTKRLEIGKHYSHT